MIFCRYCNGKGGLRGPTGWIKCRECNPSKLTAAQREAQRLLHAPLDSLYSLERVVQIQIPIGDTMDAGASTKTRQDSGALFKNAEKREGKQDPDYRGEATIGGAEFWVAGWINQSQGGVTYMGLKFRLKDQAGEPAAEDIPF